MTKKKAQDLSWFDIKNYDISKFLEGESENSAVYKVLMRHLGISLSYRRDILNGNLGLASIINPEIFIHQNPLLHSQRKDGSKSAVSSVPELNSFISGLKSIATASNPRYSRIINPLCFYALNDILINLPDISDSQILDINEEYQKITPSKTIFISVDIRATKSSIIDEFSKFIDAQQEKYDCLPMNKEKPIAQKKKKTKSLQMLFKQLNDKKVLACIDLLIFNPTLTKAELGDLLLKEFDSSTEIEKVDDILKYKEMALDQNVFNQLIQG